MNNQPPGGFMRSLMLTLIALLAAYGAEGTRVPVLVELFTSEGCSSCPPADLLLEALDKPEVIWGAEVIVLSEHVDYWNAIGWTDPFSSAQYSNRQQTYAIHFRSAGAYTPQMVVDGRAEFVGSDVRRAHAAITDAARKPKLGLQVSAESAVAFRNSGSSDADVYVVLARNRTESQVLRGENQGRHLRHVAVATQLVRIGRVKAGRELHSEGRFNRSDGDNLRVIAFVQEVRTGHIVAVARTY